MAKIRWTLKAVKNLNSIYDYISQDSKLYAARFVTTLVSKIHRLTTSPLSGRIVPEFQNENLRELIFQNYRIVYRYFKDTEIAEIIALVHSARDFNIALDSD